MLRNSFVQTITALLVIAGAAFFGVEAITGAFPLPTETKAKTTDTKTGSAKTGHGDASDPTKEAAKLPRATVEKLVAPTTAQKGEGERASIPENPVTNAYEKIPLNMTEDELVKLMGVEKLALPKKKDIGISGDPTTREYWNWEWWEEGGYWRSYLELTMIDHRVYWTTYIEERLPGLRITEDPPK